MNKQEIILTALALLFACVLCAIVARGFARSARAYDQLHDIQLRERGM